MNLHYKSRLVKKRIFDFFIVANRPNMRNATAKGDFLVDFIETFAEKNVPIHCSRRKSVGVEVELVYDVLIGFCHTRTIRELQKNTRFKSYKK